MSNFTSADGAFIPKTTAQQYCKTFRQNSPTGAVKSHFFGRDKIDQILAQNNVIGIRIFYGTSRADDDTLKPELIISGVDNQGHNILNTNMILEFSRACPPFCEPTGSETL